MTATFNVEPSTGAYQMPYAPTVAALFPAGAGVMGSTSAPEHLVSVLVTKQGLVAPFSEPLTRGLSEVALQLVVTSSLPATHLRSRAINFNRIAKMLELYSKLDDDWDGYGGQPASEESLQDAKLFLASLHQRFDAPVPMLSGDGEISLFWEKGTRYLEASFPGDGTFHYIYNAIDERYPSKDLSIVSTALDSGFLHHLRKV